jgi:hypothetical protein
MFKIQTAAASEVAGCVLGVSFMLAVVATVGGAINRTRNLEARPVSARQLVKAMDQNGDHRVSREEFALFMEARFDRLERDKNTRLKGGEMGVNWVRPIIGGAMDHPVSKREFRAIIEAEFRRLDQDGNQLLDGWELRKLTVGAG